MNPESRQLAKPDIDGAPASAEFGALVGESFAMKMVFTAIERIATTDAPVLIFGESGTGKELAARAIHQASSRAGEPFEVVDCGGLFDSPGEARSAEREDGNRAVFERRGRGTLFFDELGDLPLALQSNLLRLLREQESRHGAGAPPRHVDLRIIASTHRDLRQDIQSGLFRADLYYRLSVIQMRMPPLRERLEDIAPLVRALLPRIVRKRGLTAAIGPDDQAIASFSKYGWPGNVRELSNCLEHLITVRSLPELGAHGPSGDDASRRVPFRMDALAGSGRGGNADAFEDLQCLPFRAAKAQLVRRFERQYITQLLIATRGNVAEAARLAGVDRVTLFRAIQRTDHRSVYDRVADEGPHDRHAQG